MTDDSARIDYDSEAFWRWAIEAAEGRIPILSRWFPSIKMDTLRNAKRKAIVAHRHLEWPILDQSRIDYSKWPEDAPVGWEVAVIAEAEARDPEDAEACVERDKEVMRLRSKLSDLQSRYDAAIKEHTVEDRLIAEFRDHIPTLPAVPAPRVPRHKKGSPETVVALMSDFHIGEVVSGAETGGLAWYDFPTFAARYQHLIDSISSICFGKLTGYSLPRLEVLMLGDIVSGIIHEELVETSDGTLMEWLLDGAHIIAQGLRELATQFESVHVTGVVGNHGRLQKQYRFKKRYANYDYLLYRILALELADQPNVTFDIPQSFWHLRDIEGHTFLVMHGDGIKSWAGIPWYGIERAMAKLTGLLAAQRRFFDYACLGHFHNAGTLDRVQGELILNGSMVGGNEYSIGALFTSTAPRQVIFGVHPEKGKTWSYGIDLTDAPDDVRYKW